MVAHRATLILSAVIGLVAAETGEASADEIRQVDVTVREVAR